MDDVIRERAGAWPRRVPRMVEVSGGCIDHPAGAGPHPVQEGAEDCENHRAAQEAGRRHGGYHDRASRRRGWRPTRSVGVLERICVVRTPDMEEAMILVNPEIVKKEGWREVEEGCLSVPGYRGMVIRSEKIRAPRPGPGRQALPGWTPTSCWPRPLEHEIDHLNGIMYMDHLVAHTKLYPVQEGRRRRRVRGGIRTRTRPPPNSNISTTRNSTPCTAACTRCAEIATNPAPPNRRHHSRPIVQHNERGIG